MFIFEGDIISFPSFDDTLRAMVITTPSWSSVLVDAR